jgi:hypothetical protein
MPPDGNFSVGFLSFRKPHTITDQHGSVRIRVHP